MILNKRGDHVRTVNKFKVNFVVSVNMLDVILLVIISFIYAAIRCIFFLQKNIYW